MRPGSYNVIREPLVKETKILLPPLHIKLGLIKQYVKALCVTSEAFKEISAMFPKLSADKIRNGIFTGPQVRKMLQSENLEIKMNEPEREAWIAFRNVVHGFLGNHKSPYYEEIIQQLIKTFQKLGCRMSLKLHFLHAHLDFFRECLGDVSEEHGERFHQDISIMEKRYKSKCNVSMMGDYIWSIVRESQSKYNRKARSSKHF